MALRSDKVFYFVKRIKKGSTITYKKLASLCGNPKAARAVGNILNKNKNLISIPCHRVIKSNGEIGGYAGGITKKISLLKKEGVKIKNGKIL
ncbi:MAG: MGMT family protein [Patescibacteria group bacterium]